jgi:hypothetical protein
LTAGSDDISYAVTNSCGTVTVTQTIAINPMPDAGTITGPTSVCTGSTITLVDAAPGGTWSASNGNATVSGGVVTGVVAGTSDDISYTVTNGCGTDVASTTISIITILGGGTILSGPSTVCEGASIVLTNPVPGGTWSASNGNATVAGGTVTGVTAGTDIISYSLTNACGTNDITKSITINPLPVPGTITGLTSVCIAGTITLTDAAPGGTWSATNANATINSSGVVTGVSVGTDVISYTVSNSCGTLAATTTINVVSIPSAGTITGPSSVCEAATITLTDGVPGGSWTASNANATVTGGVVTGVTAGTDVITYTVTFSCGTAFTTFPVTINGLPSPAAITGSPSVCQGSTTVLSDATPGGVWSNSNATISGAGMVSGLLLGLDTVSYAVTNGCGTVSATWPMSVDPVVTPGVSFAASPGFTTCPGTLVTYTSSPVNGGGAPVYQWKVNGTVMGSGSAFIYTPVNGDVIVCRMTSSVACVSSPTASDTAIAIVNPTLVPSVHIAVGITGDTLCIGDAATFTATPTNGGTIPTYQWNVNGLVYAFGNPFTYVPADGDVVTCDMTSSYACPSPATITSNSVTMTVNTTETPTISITVSPGNPVCAGHAVTFSVHTLYAGLAPFYRWTKNGVNVATGPNYIYTPVDGDNIYAMLASSATCRTSDSVFSNHIGMTVVNPATMSVSIVAASGTSIAVGQSDTIAAVVTGVPFPTYQWYINGAAMAGATNSTFVVTGTLAGTEIITCVAGSGDACASTAISNILSLTINNVGVKQLYAANGSLDVQPNPSNGNFSLSLNTAVTEPVHIVISNTLGEKVRELNTTTNNIANIRLDQGAGIYFITAFTAQERYVARVVVE